ncbi:MAG: T9SS type A sorting domain-containing protein [Bacteroidota bacterium]
MKEPIRLFALAAFVFFSGSFLNGQCVPDIEGCIDINEPGQMCPSVLKEATVNVYYEQVLTVIPPNSVELPPYPVLDIAYIILDTVLNIPGGLTYEANADTFYANTAYCILISGTPTKAGVDTLSISVTPFINHPTLGIFPVPSVVNDTSVVVTVHEPAGLDPAKYYDFQVLPNIPNPFSVVTKIGFYSPFDERVELAVYNILGERLHEEKQGVPPGEHYFDFTGESLQPGTYIYRITNTKEVFTGKFIKARK